MADPRHEALRGYFILIVRDLAMRGVIRWKSGQSAEQLLVAELSTVIGEMRRDVAAVLSEMGAEAVTAGRGLLETLTTQAIRAAADFFTGKAKK